MRQVATNPETLLLRTERTGAPQVKLEESLPQQRFGPEGRTRNGIITDEIRPDWSKIIALEMFASENVWDFPTSKRQEEVEFQSNTTLQRIDLF